MPSNPPRRLALALLLAVAFPALPALAQTSTPGPLAQQYRPAADKLIALSLADNDGYNNLEYLCDFIGNRISGSEPLTRAIAWATQTMQHEGLENVHTQAATVPHWVRGEESGGIVAPVVKPFHMLGLGMSVATPPGGITAQAVVVPDFAALDRLGRDNVQGKVVVFNEPYRGYGQTVMYRVDGPSRAAALGAVAVLVRSVTPLAEQLPHTGTLVYDPAQPKIPAAAISIEDATELARLYAMGPVSVHLAMQAHLEAPVVMANVIGEIRGTQFPDQVVVMGGHIDSWDVGQGAQDDGSGIMAALAALDVIKNSGLKPKRTIRVVFWVNEENGGAGGRAYRAALSPEQLKNHVAAIEMDGGAEQPIGYGFGFSGGPRHVPAPKAGEPASAAAPPPPLTPGEVQSLAMLRDIATLLTPVGANTIRQGGGGSDVSPLMADGVPTLGEETTGAHYFDWHHTAADTFDKVDLQDFRKNVASLAVMSYILADMPATLTGHKGEAED